MFGNVAAVIIFLSCVLIRFCKFWILELPRDTASYNALTSDAWWDTSATWVDFLFNWWSSFLFSGLYVCWSVFKPSLWFIACWWRVFLLSSWRLKMRDQVDKCTSFILYCNESRNTEWYRNTCMVTEEKWGGEKVVLGVIVADDQAVFPSFPPPFLLTRNKSCARGFTGYRFVSSCGFFLLVFPQCLILYQSFNQILPLLSLPFQTWRSCFVFTLWSSLTSTFMR